MLRKLLELSRYVLVLPVIGSLLLALSVVVMGLGSLLAEQRKLLESGEFSAKAAKQLTLLVIQSVDMFLVAAIAYIVAVGIYKLFISQDEARLLKRVRIEKLADLENKIIGVVVVALAIGFLGRAEEAMDAKALLFGGAGVSLVIVALCLFLKFSNSKEE
ncbi:MAG: YqhA family protein [Planctomycetales bacterium]|nr:YqhA family protein [Planctomycetales bacterium]